MGDKRERAEAMELAQDGIHKITKRKTSAIGWTDFSGGPLNFVMGCTPVSEGCAHCYARRIYERFGHNFTDVRFDPAKFSRLWRMRFPEYSPKRGAPHRPMLFLVDTADLFHEALGDDLGFAAFRWTVEVAIERPGLVFQVLTKRARRMYEMVERWREAFLAELPPNLWLGVSAENQKRADERIPLLLDTPAAVRFVSVEPMLGPITMREEWMVSYEEYQHVYRVTREMALDSGQPGREGEPYRGPTEPVYGPSPLSWVICGAESGPNRRPFDVQWAVDLYEQCREAGVPFFGKQDSDMRPGKPLVLGDYGVVQEWPEEA